MKAFFSSIAAILFHLGGLGLFILGVLDSSFLTMPLANDVLVIALTASHHARLPYYAAMAAAGSLIGCASVDVVTRSAEETVKRRLKGRRYIKSLEDHVRKQSGWALAVASLLPPPFPFTPVVAAAAAAKYPRTKFFAIIAVTRYIRFGVEGLLAIFYGRRILALAKSAPVQYGILALIVIALAASILSAVHWIRAARKPRASPQSGRQTAKDHANP